LSMQFQDHHEFPECDHRRLPSGSDGKDGSRWLRPQESIR
jgi:hypothetical protein